jgi:hypothetical protein
MKNGNKAMLIPESRVLLNIEHKYKGPCGGGLECLHRSPASRKRRQKGNSLPGV